MPKHNMCIVIYEQCSLFIYPWMSGVRCTYTFTITNTPPNALEFLSFLFFLTFLFSFRPRFLYAFCSAISLIRRCQTLDTYVHMVPSTTSSSKLNYFYYNRSDVVATEAILSHSIRFFFCEPSAGMFAVLISYY